jgi:hypothetical protein
MLATPVVQVSLSKSVYEQPKETKTEVNIKKLPKEVRLDITKSYNGAEITKAYKTFVDGEHTGYLVEAKKGKQTWEVQYDLEGNPENRVTPLGI